MSTCETRFAPLRTEANAALGSGDKQRMRRASNALDAYINASENNDCDSQQEEADRLTLRLDAAIQEPAPVGMAKPVGMARAVKKVAKKAAAKKTAKKVAKKVSKKSASKVGKKAGKKMAKKKGGRGK
jgi:hypothetical protein